MSEVSMIGLDLAKHVFQVHGADASGRVLLCKQLRRAQVLEFFGRQPPGAWWPWRLVPARISGGVSWPGSGTRCA